jgi:hypothetical protein
MIPGDGQHLEGAEIDQPGQQRAVDGVVDEHGVGLEYPGGLFDDPVGVWGDLEGIGEVGDVEGLVLQAQVLGGGGLVHHGEALALVRFSRHRGRGRRRIDGDDVESHPRQAACQQPAPAAHD